MAYLWRVHILAADGQQNLANSYTRAGALWLSKSTTHSSLHATHCAEIMIISQPHLRESIKSQLSGTCSFLMLWQPALYHIRLAMLNPWQGKDDIQVAGPEMYAVMDCSPEAYQLQRRKASC